MKKKNKLKTNKLLIFSHIYFVLYSICCILPFLLLIGVSFSNEKDILDGGFSLIPKHFTLAAYEYVLSDLSSLVSAYGISIFYSVVGTVISVVLMAGVAYTLARQTFRYKKILTVLLLISMLFTGGLTSEYIYNTTVYNIGNTLWIYLFNNTTVVAYTVFVFRTFFKGIPESLIESASLDGASELQMLTKIMLPLSKPLFATFGFMGLVNRWNDLQISLYYISDKTKYTLQLVLQNVLNEAEYLKQLRATMSMPSTVALDALPTETMKFAMCILACGPMIVIFPFFQKYFTKGMVVGAVKG